MSVNTLLNERVLFLTDIKNNPNRYMDFLHAMAKFYKYPLMQQINLYIHAPAATPAVASKHIINDVLHWRLNEDAPAIEILHSTTENDVEQVYDIRNTHYYQELPNKDLSQIIWQYEPEMHYAILNELFPGEGEISERILDSLLTESYNKYGNDIQDSELLALTSTYIILERLGCNAEAELGMQFIMHTWQDFDAGKLLNLAGILAEEKLKIIESYVKNSKSEKEQEYGQNKGNRDRENIFLGEWANARMNFLKEQKPAYWQEMLSQGTTRQYLEQYQEDYRKKYEHLQNQIMKAKQIPEEQPKEMSWLEYLNLMTMVAETTKEMLLREICEMD